MENLTLITGAARGIGLELTKQALARGHRVIASVRKASDELRALGDGVEIVAGIDVTDPAAHARLAKAVGARRLGLLLHDAGILERSSLDALDAASIRRQLEVNAIAPLMLTAALRGALGDGSRLVVITSRMGSIGDNGSGGAYGYRMSKAAVNAAFRSLSVDLRAQGVAVGILHPGYVRTGMTGGSGSVSAEESARLLFTRIDELTLASTGTFLHASGEPLPW